jgi:hypothetical protein
MRAEQNQDQYHRVFVIFPKDGHPSSVNVYQRADILKNVLLPAEISWYGSATKDIVAAESLVDAMNLALATAKSWNKDASKPAAEVLEG